MLAGAFSFTRLSGYYEYEGRTKRPTHKENRYMNDKKAHIKGNDSMLKMVKGSSQLPAPAIETYTIERDDDRPLQFNGRLIGSNEPDESHLFGTRVEVFVTRSGKIVTAVYQWQREKGRERWAAAAHQMPEDALNWLKADGGGYLGRASKEAWGEACENHLPLQGQNVEIID